MCGRLRKSVPMPWADDGDRSRYAAATGKSDHGIGFLASCHLASLPHPSRHAGKQSSPWNQLPPRSVQHQSIWLPRIWQFTRDCNYARWGAVVNHSSHAWHVSMPTPGGYVQQPVLRLRNMSWVFTRNPWTSEPFVDGCLEGCA